MLHRNAVIVATAALAGLTGLEVASAAVAGLDFYNGNSSSYVMNAAARRFATRFTASEDISVNAATYYVNSVAGAPQVQISVFADAGGVPTGTALASGTAVPSAGAGYKTLTLDNAASLTAGQVYHFVYSVANGSATDSIGIRSTGSGAEIANAGAHTASGTPELNSARLYSTNNGTTWTADTVTTQVWGLHNTTTDQAIGNPYFGGNWGTIGGNVSRGQSFTFSGFGPENGIDEVSVRINKTGTTDDDLRLHIIDTTTDSSIWSGIVVARDAATGIGIHTVSLGEGIALVSGRKYILGLESENASAGNIYNAYFNTTTAPLPLLGENFQEEFGSIYLTRDVAVSDEWADSYPLSTTARYDLYFKLGLAEVVPEPASLSLLAFATVAMTRRRRV